MLSRHFDAECNWFRENASQHHRLRPYQIDANTAIEDASSKRKRQMLVAMATGTGKTFTLDHFDAIKVGLTATPAAHTKAYFNDVVYRYEYARAVREGYLVDYDVVTVKVGRADEGRLLEGGRARERRRPGDGPPDRALCSIIA
jgi:type I site-specific restriction endonuclease